MCIEKATARSVEVVAEVESRNGCAVELAEFLVVVLARACSKSKGAFAAVDEVVPGSKTAGVCSAGLGGNLVSVPRQTACVTVVEHDCLANLARVLSHPQLEEVSSLDVL